MKNHELLLFATLNRGEFMDYFLIKLGMAILALIIVILWVLFRELTSPPPPASAAITGSVTNSNAAPNNTVTGVTITAALESTPSNIVATTVTDANGNYTFSSLANGDYVISAFMSDADGSTLSAAENVTLNGVNVTAPVLALVKVIPRLFPYLSTMPSVKAFISPSGRIIYVC